MNGPTADWEPIETAPKDGSRFRSQDRTNYRYRVFSKSMTPSPMTPETGDLCPTRGEIRVIGGNTCRFIERELEGDKWEILGPAPAETGDRSQTEAVRVCRLLDVRQERLTIQPGKSASYCPLDAKLDAEAAALIRSLSAPLPAGGEAVAWRVRANRNHPLVEHDPFEWRLSETKPALGEGAKPEWFDVEALGVLAAPPAGSRPVPPEVGKELREALESIARNTCCDTCQEAALVARAALQRERG